MYAKCEQSLVQTQCQSFKASRNATMNWCTRQLSQGQTHGRLRLIQASQVAHSRNATISICGISKTLSRHIWSLKRENIQYELSWKILTRGRVFNPVTKTCQLCLKEKFLIIFSPEGATLNKRNELFSTCRHRLNHRTFARKIQNLKPVIISFW